MIFYFSYKKLVFSWKKLPKMISRPLASFECTGGSPWLAVKHHWKPMKGFGDILWMFRKSESFLKVIERHRRYLLAFIHRPSMSFIQNYTIILSVKENCEFQWLCKELCRPVPWTKSSRQSSSSWFKNSIKGTSLSPLSLSLFCIFYLRSVRIPWRSPILQCSSWSWTSSMRTPRVISPNYFSTCLENSLFLLKMFLIPG